MTKAKVEAVSSEDILPPPVKIVKETRTLRYKFPAEELADISVQLVDKLNQTSTIKAQADESKAEFNSQLKANQAQIERLTQLHSSGFEERATECETSFHTPEQGMKRTVRMDTLEEIDVKPMTDFECQTLYSLSPKRKRKKCLKKVKMLVKLKRLHQ